VISPPIATGGRAVNPAVAELASIPRWVCWRLEIRDGKPTKVPYTPAGSKAKSTDPRTWSTFDECFTAAFVDGRHDGIGFVFADDDDLAGVDLDTCVDNGTVAAWAAEIIAGMASYAEISPSGTGVKLFCRAKLPEPGRRNGKLEVYGAKRFFTITGSHLKGSPDRISGAQAALDQLWAKHFSKPRVRTNGHAGNGADTLPPYPDQAAIDALLRDPTVAAYWHQRQIVTPEHDQSASGWDLAFAGYLTRTGRSRLEIAALLRAYRAHTAPAKGKQDRTDYIFETVDRAIGDVPPVDEDETFTSSGTGTAQAQSQPVGSSGAAIMPKPTDWLWFPYFPAGELSLIGAKGGVGKGQACASIVARLTSGILWPDGIEKAADGHVLWAEAEDSLEKTVIPRLIANRAKRELVTFFNEEEFAVLDLRTFISRHDCRAVILSPIMSFLPRLKSHIDELAVRAALKGLRAAVEGTSCALIGIAHLNKKTDLDAIERLLGSVAFANYVRSVVLIATDKDQQDTRRWIHAKYNLSVRGRDLLFRTIHAGQDPKDQFVRTDWELPNGENVDTDSFFDRRKPGGDSAHSARNWLVSYLEQFGETPASIVITAAEKAGFTSDAIEKARRREKRCKSRKGGFGEGWLWWTE
jgi:AAA domain